ncbi:Chromosome partition protein smc [Moraxella catarrhalis]|uniref:AAA family ATPase n=1 Tax=Moraxella catarrhalis TaxID=480 RepID=UPI0007E2FC35|nr:AAA family ATPase [Moraxella catarrhalis]OAV31200.1 Chromosome partition protein smc [Moraxella catarrhalis]
MRLKSLKLAGFKSFANPTTFTFRHDITAIVGPNGCGKSNVIDAIRWVLGETSAKQLRGGAMSDVIFAGVEGRAAKSLASVELIFEHTQDETHGIRHELNLYQELSLRRQVTKEGKSDYFINGQRVRRRDVVDVFLGTGLGARSYAVIEQGMIGRIVESSPMQLREFIEEGAGVSRYQARRAETEKKLGETQDNLKRLSDLQGELKKQHKTLIRQAQSAKQYQALNDELKTLQKEELIRRLFEAWHYHEQKKIEQGKSGEVLAKLDAKANQVRRELDLLSARVAEAQWLKDDAKDNYHNAQMAEQTAQHNFYTVNSQITQNDEKIARLQAQHQEALTKINQAQDELLQINQSLDVITPKAEAMTHEITHAKQAQSEVQLTWQSHRDELSSLMQEKNNLENLKKLAQSQRQRLKTAIFPKRS